jgi:hypothetical protein
LVEDLGYDRASSSRVAKRKLPELTAMIERAILVQRWLEAAARCECPSLNECDLFVTPELPPARAVTQRAARF